MAKKLLKLTTLLAILLLVFMLTGCPKPPAEEYTLTIEKTGNGTVTSDPAPNTSGKYAAGTEVTLTAVADAGWQFAKWVVGETDVTNNTVVVTMDADKTVKAFFEEEEPPVDQFTLTVAKAGDGDGTVDPAVGDHVYNEGAVVTLTATPDANSDFVMWVVDGVEFEEATVVATMTKDILATAHFDLKETEKPKVYVEWIGGSQMIVEAPCTYPANGTGLQFQYKVDDYKKSLESASWSILKGEAIVHEEAIDDAKFYNFVFGNLVADFLGENPEGGLYHLAVTATNSGGGTTTVKIPFYVHVDLAQIVDYEFTSGIVTYDGVNIIPIAGTPSATLEATITLDSKVRVRIVAFVGEEWDCECPDNVILYDKVITRDASSTEKEIFDLDLTKLTEDVTYRGIQIVLYNEGCGPWPCGVCPDDMETISIYFDTEVCLECIPCVCNPCDPCWPGYGEPGLEISGLLFADLGEFFEVSATVNGQAVPEGDITYSSGNAFFRISKGMFDPELNGDVSVLWEVTTITGQATELECKCEIDFVPPEVEIDIDCWPCDDATKVVSFDFRDDVGLRKVGARFENVAEVTFSATPTGKTQTTFTNPAGWFFFGPTFATVDATITVDTVGEGQIEEVEYSVYGRAEDTFCNTFEASKTCTLDTTPPNVHFGLECIYCDLECGATETVLAWYIEDAGDISGTIEVNFGELNGEAEPFEFETKSGTVLWEFEDFECGTIVATITVLDDCLNETEKTFSAEIDNVDPVIILNADNCFDFLECDSTNTTLFWEASGECDVEVFILVNVGELYIDGRIIFTDPTSLPFTVPDNFTAYATTTLMGEIEWRFGPEYEFDCTYIDAYAFAMDACGNLGTDYVTSYDVGVRVDHLSPDATISVVDEDGDAPSCDASCVYIDWEVEENCLESVEIWANYPNVTCGTNVPAIEGEYLIFKAVGAELDEYENNGSSRALYGDTIKICLPMIDCDTYVATIVAYDTCGASDTEFDVTHSIDRLPPVLEFGWEEVPTSCATEATLTVSITDGSFPCETCGEGDCQIGLLEWEFRPVNGNVTSYEQLEIYDDDLDIVLGTHTYSGSLYLEAPLNVDCGTYVATFTANDCCCSLELSNTVSKAVRVYVDTEPPEVSIFGFSDKDGGSVQFEGCNATNTYLTWDATDACFDRINIEVSHGELVWGDWTTLDATGVVEWRFGQVSGETVIATLTAYDQCNETVAGALMAYIRNTGPVLWSGTSFRFDAQSDTVVLRFNEEVETTDATAVLYFRTNPDDDWLAMATYIGSDGIYPGGTGLDYVVVDVEAYDERNIVSDPEIVLGTQYRLELFDVYATDENCSDEEFYTEPNPIVVEGQGTALSPEL